MGQPTLLPGGPQMGDGPLLAEDLPEEPGAGRRGRRGGSGSCLIFFCHFMDNFPAKINSQLISLNHLLKKGTEKPAFLIPYF